MNESSQSTPSSSHSGVSRRRLVRAGLSAAPVMAALTSNSVLAGDHTCIRPSSFSSLSAAKMKVSQGRVIKTDYECKSPESWASSSSGLATNFKETMFLSTTTKFTENPGGDYSKVTIQDVLEGKGKSRKNAALARYVAAAYLSATAFNNDSTRVLLTTAQCRAIWNGQGNWSPFAGTTWNANQTLAYFDAIYGRSFL